MQVSVTARHLELTPSLRQYAEKRLMQVKKYTEKITSVHVIMNVEKDRHIAEVVLGVSKSKINAKATAGDMYAAIDMVMDKVVKQLRRLMSRVKEHKDLPSYTEVENMVKEEGTVHEDNRYNFSEIREVQIKRQTVDEAISSMENQNISHWAFENSNDSTVRIIYQNDDGSRSMLIIK